MLEQFRNKFQPDDDTWNDYKSRFKRIDVPAKTILLVFHHLIWLTKGR